MLDNGSQTILWNSFWRIWDLRNIAWLRSNYHSCAQRPGAGALRGSLSDQPNKRVALTGIQEAIKQHQINANASVHTLYTFPRLAGTTGGEASPPRGAALRYALDRLGQVPRNRVENISTAISVPEMPLSFDATKKCLS